MAVLLSDVQDLKLGALRSGRPVSTAQVLVGDKHQSVQLVPSSDLDKIWMPLEPTSWNNQDTRLGLLFNIPDATAEALSNFEACVRELLRSEIPNVDALWTSAVKTNPQFGHSLRAKIRPQQCVFVDSANSVCDVPQNWRHVCAIPQLLPTVYMQTNQVGIIWTCTALKLGAERASQRSVSFV